MAKENWLNEQGREIEDLEAKYDTFNMHKKIKEAVGAYKPRQAVILLDIRDKIILDVNYKVEQWALRVGRHNQPTEQTISNTVEKFEETGSVTDIVRPLHHRNIRSAENIAVVAQSVEEHPNSSIPRRAQHLGLSYGSLWRILQLGLKLHPYKVQLTQELKPQDNRQRRTYANWVIEQQAVDDNFSNRIFFSDEAHFSLGGYVNEQNSRRWGSQNPSSSRISRRRAFAS
ncbi:hypothetical protein HUJ05_003320 [Dendroctonus ponderosae]|nr:hypothetical protein HUJ05_008636 [Dendroctonus ponderosae]KAH1023714.1 hypothetical protein HUJ05_003320 [Dendroctonus ponderosae]